MNKHSEPLFQKSNFAPPGMINFSNIFITPPKTFQFVLRSRGERNTDFVRFVTILPIFAAKRPDYYSQLSPYGHLAITDTPLLRTLCKSPAKPIINYIAVALAITDTSCGPQHNIFIVLLSLQRTPWTYFSLNTT